MILQIKRLLSQFFFLIFSNLGINYGNNFLGKSGFCYPFFYCHSCPTSTAACPIRGIEVGLEKFKDNSDINWWQFIIYPIFIIGFVGVLSGRWICGWACPIGFLQRVTSIVPKKIRKNSHIQKIGQHKIESYLRYVKYFIFLGLVIITTLTIGIMFTDICPVGFLVGTIPISILNPGEYFPNEFYYIASIIFILFLFLIFTIERGWCKYFCPVGAMFAPFNKISILNIKVDKEDCIHCNACSNNCPMGIDVPNMQRDPECILCGKCMDVCPKNLIRFERN